MRAMGESLMNRLKNCEVVFIIICALFVLAPAMAIARGTVVYVENFDNNVNGWWTGENETAKGEVRDGSYILSRNVDAPGILWSNIPLPIDQNRDFQLDLTMRHKGGATNHGYGPVWGMRPGGQLAYHYFNISNDRYYASGFYSEGKYVSDGWKKADMVLPGPQPNLLMVKRAGGEMILGVNGSVVYRGPYKPNFGGVIGVTQGSTMVVEVDRLAATGPSDNIPSGWTMISEGSFKNSIIWQNPKDERRFLGEVYNGGKLMAGRMVKGNQAYVSAEFKTINDPGGESAGIYLLTDEGAMLKLERFRSPDGIRVRFSPSIEGKELGNKEAVLPHKAHIIYRIVRKGDIFKGEVLVDSKKTTEVGNLTWPNLSKNQVAGVIISYNNNGTKVPDSFKCEFADFYAGESGK
jgi:hypothetical protein